MQLMALWDLQACHMLHTHMYGLAYCLSACAWLQLSLSTSAGMPAGLRAQLTALGFNTTNLEEELNTAASGVAGVVTSGQDVLNSLQSEGIDVRLPLQVWLRQHVAVQSTRMHSVC